MFTKRVSYYTAIAVGLIGLGLSNVQAQIVTTGNVSPAASAPAGGTFQTDGQLTIGTGGGAGTLNTNRIVVDNATLQIDEVAGPIGPGQFDGTRLHVGTGLGEGSLLIQNGGSLAIRNTGSPGRVDGAGLQISNIPGVDGTASLQGRVDVMDGSVTIEGDDVSAFANIGLDGSGIFNATNSVVTLQSGAGSAVFNLGGAGLVTVPTAGSQGAATIDNSSLTLNSDSTTGGSAFLNVGRNGVGSPTTSTLNVINGSTVSVTNDDSFGATFFNVGRNGTTGVANIDASTVTIADYINVSRDGGTGTLNLANGATINNTSGIGLTQTGLGGGSGTITVRSGSVLNTNSLFLGRDAGSSGTATVADTGSTVNATDVIVGRIGAGTLNIGDGPGSTTGIVNAHTTIVGTNQGSTGTLNMSGAGALLNLAGLAPNNIPGSLDGATLLVGLRGDGTVNLTNGANITITATPPVNGFTGGMTIGGSTNNPIGTGDGTVNVDGIGSVLALNGGISQIGRDGTGMLNIINGGSVLGATQAVAVIGRKTGGDGTVNVTGTGSTWTANRVTVGIDTALPAGTAFSGPGGEGTLNVADGGSVTANEIFVAGQGRLTGGGGTIASDIVIGDAVIGGGTIAAGNSPGLMSVSGNLGLLGGSTMEIELGGTVFDSGIPQFDYDRVDVSDNIATAGTVEGTVTIDSGAIFDIDFFGAFTAGLGDTFDVIVADDIASVSLTSLIFDFTGAALATGLDWNVDIVSFVGGREALQFAVVAEQVAVSEPSIGVTLGIGLAGLAFARRRRVVRR